MERSEFDVKTRLTQQIEKVERENAVLRKKVEGTDEQQRAFVNTLEVKRNFAHISFCRLINVSISAFYEQVN